MWDHRQRCWPVRCQLRNIAPCCMTSATASQRPGWYPNIKNEMSYETTNKITNPSMHLLHTAYHVTEYTLIMIKTVYGSKFTVYKWLNKVPCSTFKLYKVPKFVQLDCITTFIKNCYTLSQRNNCIKAYIQNPTVKVYYQRNLCWASLISQYRCLQKWHMHHIGIKLLLYVYHKLEE